MLIFNACVLNLLWLRFPEFCFLRVGLITCYGLLFDCFLWTVIRCYFCLWFVALRLPVFVCLEFGGFVLLVVALVGSACDCYL